MLALSLSDVLQNDEQGMIPRGLPSQPFSFAFDKVLGKQIFLFHGNWRWCFNIIFSIKNPSPQQKGRQILLPTKKMEGKLQITNHSKFFSLLPPPLTANCIGCLAFRILVIGAGVSGLVAAKKVTEGLEGKERFGELPGTPKRLEIQL